MGYHNELHLINKGKDPTNRKRNNPWQPKSNLPTLEEKKAEEEKERNRLFEILRPKFKPIYTHPDIIEYFMERNISILAFYYKLKQHYKNSTIYNWNPNKIKNRCEVSYYVASKYSKLLVEHGLAKFIQTKKGEHLFLFSMKKIYFKLISEKYRKGWVELNIKYKQSIPMIKDGLRNVITYKTVKDQEYWVNIQIDNLSLDQENPSSKISIKRAKQIERLRQRYPEKFDRKSVALSNVIGMRRLGQKLGLSHSGANNFLKRMKKDGVVKTQTWFRLAKEVKGLTKPEEYAEYFADYPGWFYRTRFGRIGVIFGTNITYYSNTTTPPYVKE